MAVDDFIIYDAFVPITESRRAWEGIKHMRPWSLGPATVLERDFSAVVDYMRRQHCLVSTCLLLIDIWGMIDDLIKFKMILVFKEINGAAD